MNVLSIEDVSVNENQVNVVAVVEDMRLRYAATYFDPEEWEPALCSSSFELYENEKLPTDDVELLDYINNLDLDWELLPDDY